MTLTTTSGDAVPLTYTTNYLDAGEADRLLSQLESEIPWAETHIQRDTQTVTIPRLICWIGGPDYLFYGAQIQTHPWTSALAALRDRLGADTGARYNSVLLNLYRNGLDFVDMARR